MTASKSPAWGLGIYTGKNWKCNRGYKKVGPACEKVVLPKNAELDYTGSRWKCIRGYYKFGNGCVDVSIPNNAELDYTGSRWKCSRGYYKSGNQCRPVSIPQNAELDYTGSRWKCQRGYKKSNNSCIQMTQAELKKQKELEQAILAEMKRRKLQGVSGDDCETEYKTNAEVCVNITGGDLDCNKSYAGKYYRDCNVTLSYDVETDYPGGSYLDVEVECKVEIEYKGRQTYSTDSDSSTEDDSHSLSAHGSDSETMSFNFSFSSYRKITRVKISSAECEIQSVDLQ